LDAKEFSDAIGLVGGFASHSPQTPLLVVGGGPTVWDDYRRLTARLTTYQVLAVNAVGCYVPECHYWFSLHADYLANWALTRQLLDKGHGYTKPMLIALHTTGQYAGNPIFPSIDREVSIGDPTIKRSAKHGGALEDSGFFAMCLGVAAGFQRVYLVGMPADDSGHIFIPKWNYLEHDTQAIREAWMSTLSQYPILKERVRSMSGLTRELLGEEFPAPEKEW